MFWVITKGCFKKKSQSFRFTAAFASDILTNKKTNVRKNEVGAVGKTYVKILAEHDEKKR